MFKIILLSLIITIFNTPIAISQETKEKLYDKIPSKLFNKSIGTVGGGDFEAFNYRMIAPFRSSTRGKMYLERSDIKDMIDAKIYEFRMFKVISMLSRDKNYDGVISQEDLDKILKAKFLENPTTEEQKKINEEQAEIMKDDLNKDGEISLKEANYVDDEYKNKIIDDIKNRLEPYFEYGDFNNDNIVTLDEMRQLVSNIFNILDLDGSSFISTEEFQAYKQYREEKGL
ncbi:MAG: hypothetical protein AB7U85_10215 [Alphaproteobacteria bacterium]